MSYLYESNYRAGWDNYIRVFDTETNRSICNGNIINHFHRVHIHVLQIKLSNLLNF